MLIIIIDYGFDFFKKENFCLNIHISNILGK